MERDWRGGVAGSVRCARTFCRKIDSHTVSPSIASQLISSSLSPCRLCDNFHLDVSLRLMEIQIPSPSVFLQRSPVLSANVDPPVVPAPKKASKTSPIKPVSGFKKSNNTTSSGQNGAVAKPKQSKSRNGMSHRLSVDEVEALIPMLLRMYHLQEEEAEMR